MLDGWIENRTGTMPRILAGKRVRVRLRCGRMPAETWPADGKQGCRWTLENHPYDITHYKPAD